MVQGPVVSRRRRGFSFCQQPSTIDQWQLNTHSSRSSTLLASGDVKGHLELILDLDCSSGSRDEANFVITLAERTFPRRAQHIAGQPDTCGYRLLARHSVQRKLTAECHCILPLSSLAGGDFGTFIHDLRITVDFEYLLMGS